MITMTEKERISMEWSLALALVKFLCGKLSALQSEILATTAI